MDYERKYKVALGNARQEYNTTENVERKQWLEELFPELVESEDERIKNKLIKLIKMSSEVGGFALHKWEADEMLAWLEKQSEQSICNTPSKEIILAIWELGNDWKELTGGSISTAYGTQLDYIQNHWNESEYYLRAKQDEQKPTNKVEPKFNVGDWIISKYMRLVMKIINNDNGSYKTVETDGTERNDSYDFIERNFKLWTIQDAKEGDVLANDHHILILKELYYDWYSRYSNGTPYSVKAYCGIKPNGNFEIGKDNWCFCGTLHIHPATKEQRDLLFQKMKEAGYEWDAVKKEPKKIEKKPVPKRKAEGVLKEMLENIDEEELKQTKKEMLEEVFVINKFKKLMEESKPIPPEFQKVINEKFWEML